MVIQIKDTGEITNKEYRMITDLSDEGARIDLNNLVSKGLLKSMGSGRGVHYVLNEFGDYLAILAIIWQLVNRDNITCIN